MAFFDPNDEYLNFDAITNPHEDQPVLEKGAKIEEADGVLILIHGRGATAESIFALYNKIGKLDPDLPGRFSWFAPQARSNFWYPYSFVTPIEKNRTWLSSALSKIDGLVQRSLDAGVPGEKIMLGGFSQGAILSSEYAARNARRYGGVLALSGGLMGETLDRKRYQGSMKGTPVFLGCSDHDPFIPEKRVHESAEVFREMEADVTKIIYPGLGHNVNDDEMRYFRRMLKGLMH